METAQQQEKKIEAILVNGACEENAEDWDLVIEPKKGLFALNLAEVWQYRDLLLLFVKRDFTAQYKQTVLGPVWHFVQPVFTTAVFLLLFGAMANFPTDGIQPVLFYLSGITIWNYFSASLLATSNTFITNAGIFGKVYFPRLVMPLSMVASNMVKFGIQFLLLLGAMICFWLNGQGFHVGWSWLLVPLLVVIMAGFGLGLGIIISSLTTKYRDFNVLIGFAVQLLMYTTPIAYPLSFLKSKSYASWIAWNPLSPVVEGFRFAVFGAGDFQMASLFYSTTCMLILLFTGILLFNRVEKTFMDTV
ncbi:MAG: ABC transporter permease [Sphingobacteriales bacterium]|nr:MAG: ABC transporter permease [Sphingobacteriales bacterium]